MTPKKVKFTQLSAQQRFTALQSGEVDILARNTTHTLSRDTALGLNFAPITFYDGQGFMVRKKVVSKAGKTLKVQQYVFSKEQQLKEILLIISEKMV